MPEVPEAPVEEIRVLAESTGIEDIIKRKIAEDAEKEKKRAEEAKARMDRIEKEKQEEAK